MQRGCGLWRRACDTTAPCSGLGWGEMTWETEELSTLPPSCKVSTLYSSSLFEAIPAAGSLLLSVSLGTRPHHYFPSLAGNVCNLQSLGLGGNDIHDEGAIHLAQALKTNTRLCSLGLGGNQIGRNIMLQSH